MIQAINEDRKTQTRRLRGLDEVNQSPNEWNLLVVDDVREDRRPAVFGALFQNKNNPLDVVFVKSPYGEPEDSLWVRETWVKAFWGVEYAYKASPETWHDSTDKASETRWKPSIYMPKIASRIKLMNEFIGVERLNDISEEDAIAEGINRTNIPGIEKVIYWDYENNQLDLVSPKDSYATLWRKINGPDSWEQNPWIWKIKFSVMSTKGKP